MMRAGVVALLGLALLGAVPARAVEKRCGWLWNPTPGNFSLRDGKAEWIISSQGDDAAADLDNLPDVTTRGWVETNGSYGYGCGCIVAELDRRAKRVVRLVSAEPLPLARCRADRRLPAP